MIKQVELHVHLEGTISPALALRFAKRHGITLPDNFIAPDGENYISNDFLHFLSVYDTLANCIKVPEDYYELTLDYLKTRALEGAIYVEMMYSPDHAERSTGIPSHEHLAAIQQAIEDAEHQYGIIGRILITAVRHFGAESVTRVAENMAKNPNVFAVGFGLGGDEIHYPAELFTTAYQIIHEAAIPATAHAGEFADANSIRRAVECLNITRVGHGVRAIDSPEVMQFLKENRIALELCPSSNIKLGLFKDMASHPLPHFLDEGLMISISSDDPPFMFTTLAKEYERVQTAYNYNDATMQRITHMAIDSAFVDETTKQRLRERV